MDEPTGKHAQANVAVYVNKRVIRTTVTDIVPVGDSWRGRAVINGQEIVVNKTPTFGGWVAERK